MNEKQLLELFDIHKKSQIEIRHVDKTMNEKQLLEFFDIHKNGQIDIRHAWTEKIYNTSISLEELFEMFRLYLIRRDNAVTQD